jgi:hypothetical protein
MGELDKLPAKNSTEGGSSDILSTAEELVPAFLMAAGTKFATDLYKVGGISGCGFVMVLADGESYTDLGGCTIRAYLDEDYPPEYVQDLPVILEF